MRLVGYYEHEGGYINNIARPLTYQRASAAGVPDPITVNNDSLAKNNLT